uniref:Receptor-like protein kinase HSL1 n=1 Tax=Nicotiana tabacum TaxID=4097 RepID=A0A1S3XLG7_TOBAC|nr:PREDICTED: receptor-like protein kinase HSL1 [Nicotiana tabacum]
MLAEVDKYGNTILHLASSLGVPSSLELPSTHSSVVPVKESNTDIAPLFTVPGGFDQNSGIPVLDKDNTFYKFIVVVYSAILFSFISLAALLSLQRSTFYAEEFYISVPLKASAASICLMLAAVFATTASALALVLESKRPSSNQEKTILLQLKEQLSTTSPFFLNRWTSSSDHCTWPEISCTHDNSVRAIRLVNLSISKPIPPFICDLKNVTFLDVNNNLIPGPFPTLLYYCSNLEYLDLSFNFMNSSLPNDINRLSPKLHNGGLKQLKELQFASNAFHGSFPAEIGDLTNLESLILNLNKFAPQEIPSSFTKLKKLKNIWMSEINLIGEIPESIGNMSALEFLDLSMNGLSGSIPNSLFQPKNLTIVYLYTNRLSGQIPQIIESFNLEGIYQ